MGAVTSEDDTAGRLVTPWDVDGVLIQVLTDTHAQHLAAHERRRGLQPGTLERFQTVGRLSDPGDHRTGYHRWPAVLVGTQGAARFLQADGETRDAVLDVGVAIVVAGTSMPDAHERRDVLTWTTLECLVCRTPREGDPIQDVEVVEVAYQDPAGLGNGFLLEASVRLDVRVAEAFRTRWLPVLGDDRIPPGDPGGPPSGPYEPPVPVEPVRPFTPGVTKEPITEWI